MLLDQELRGVPVVTLGSTVAERTDPDVLSVMLKSPEWFIALDADQAGDRAAAKFPAWAIRVRPPEGVKDWTELWQSGRNRIRYQWGRYLPLSKSWDVLAAQAPGTGPGEPGSHRDQPVCGNPTGEPTLSNGNQRPIVLRQSRPAPAQGPSHAARPPALRPPHRWRSPRPSPNPSRGPSPYRCRSLYRRRSRGRQTLR